MIQDTIEQEKMQEPKGSEFRVDDLLTGFTFTNKTSVKFLIDAVNSVVNTAFESGYWKGFGKGYEAHRKDQAEEAEVAYERGQLDD